MLFCGVIGPAVMFDIFRFIVCYVLAFITTMAVRSPEARFAFGRIAKKHVFCFAPETSDNKIPVARDAIG